MAQSDARDQEVAGLIPAWFFNIEIDHEIFSVVIQEGLLSISGERMCTNTGSCQFLVKECAQILVVVSFW